VIVGQDAESPSEQNFDKISVGQVGGNPNKPGLALNAKEQDVAKQIGHILSSTAKATPSAKTAKKQILEKKGPSS
jgi:hypothetical protein